MDPEVWSIVTEELSALPETQREVLHKFLLEGQSYEHLAESLNIPRSTVASRIRRGRQVLRARLAARGLAVAGMMSTVSLATANVPHHLCAATVENATALINGQMYLLPVSLVSLMKGVITNMDKIGKFVLLAVLGLATASPMGFWLARQESVGSSDMPIADSAQPGPTLESALHLNVTLPPDTPITVTAEPSLTFSN